GTRWPYHRSPARRAARTFLRRVAMRAYPLSRPSPLRTLSKGDAAMLRCSLSRAHLTICEKIVDGDNVCFRFQIPDRSLRRDPVTGSETPRIGLDPDHVFPR